MSIRTLSLEIDTGASSTDFTRYEADILSNDLSTSPTDSLLDVSVICDESNKNYLDTQGFSSISHVIVQNTDDTDYVNVGWTTALAGSPEIRVYPGETVICTDVVPGVTTTRFWYQASAAKFPTARIIVIGVNY